jgi:UDP-glucose 4-epimerase
MVLPRFVEQALRGLPITVYGDGSQVRSFTWVGDAVEATVRLMDAPTAEGRVFNVGSEEAVTIRGLAERVRRLTGSASEIVHVPYEEAYGRGFEDIRHRVPDVTRLRQTVGYAPQTPLDLILARVIAHTRAHLTRQVEAVR